MSPGRLRLLYNEIIMEKSDKKSTDLSASISDPYSKSSSTIPIAESLLASLFIESRDLFLNISDLSLFFFLGGNAIGAECSGGIISTTIQVVSSFKSLVLKAS